MDSIQPVVFSDDVIALIGNYLNVSDRNNLRIVSKAFHAAHWNRKYHIFIGENAFEKYRIVKKAKPFLSFIELNNMSYNTAKAIIDIAEYKTVDIVSTVDNFEDVYNFIGVNLKQHENSKLFLYVRDPSVARPPNIYQNTKWKSIYIQMSNFWLTDVSTQHYIIENTKQNIKQFAIIVDNNVEIPNNLANIECALCLSYHIIPTIRLHPDIINKTSHLIFNTVITDTFWLSSIFDSEWNSLELITFTKPIICGIYSTTTLSKLIEIVKKRKVEICVKCSTLTEPSSFYFLKELAMRTSCNISIHSNNDIHIQSYFLADILKDYANVKLCDIDTNDKDYLKKLVEIREWSFLKSICASNRIL
jgi:hypothetical protein